MKSMQLLVRIEPESSEFRYSLREADSARDFSPPSGKSFDVTRESVWLCLYFPDLPISIFEQTDKPLAVAKQQGSRHVICAVNAIAEGFGVAVGMPVNAAYVLCRRLSVLMRDEVAERERLQKLAEWMGQFTPVISIRPSGSLLLEVSGSLKLFGGLQNLHDRILTLLQKRIATVSAVAPTPLAAWLLASNGLPSTVLDKVALKSALGEISLHGFDLPDKLLQRVEKIGVRSLRDLWRLPRDGLLRRFGQDLVDSMDKASGAKPDPQAIFLPQARYQNSLDMPLPSNDAGMLATICEKLLQDALGFLRSHDAATSEILFTLRYEVEPESVLSIVLQQPSRDLQRFMRLIRERLDRLRLSALVVSVSLKINRPEAFVAQATDMFDNKQNLQNDWQEVIEALQARLGKEAVYGLRIMQDHRPERAYQYVASEQIHRQVHRQTHGQIKKPVTNSNNTERPLWLLKQSEPINVKTLNILSAPERIESGWWDNADVRRTYYVAYTQHHERWWVFHNMDENGWYKHGIF